MKKKSEWMNESYKCYKFLKKKVLRKIMAGLYLAKLIPDISKLHRILGTGTGDNGVKKKCVFKFSASC